MTQKNDGTFETMTYMGKIFKKAGTTKDGREWKIYKAQFLKPGRQNPNTFTIFNTVSQKSAYQTEELQEGTQYNIGYSTEQRTHPSGETYESKTIFWIGEPRVEHEATTKQTTTTKTLEPQGDDEKIITLISSMGQNEEYKEHCMESKENFLEAYARAAEASKSPLIPEGEEDKYYTTFKALASRS